MPPKNDQIVVQNLRPPLKAPVFPSTSTEFINVMAHYHRAEIARMAGWRDRIDRTTNWAITVVAAMLSVSLSTPTAHHGVLIFAMVLVLLLLVIEARRYRFFDVYRNRVRRMERNYYAQIFAPQDGTTDDWILKLGEDLRQPLFLTSTRQALSRRQIPGLESVDQRGAELRFRGGRRYYLPRGQWTVDLRRQSAR